MNNAKSLLVADLLQKFFFLRILGYWPIFQPIPERTEMDDEKFVTAQQIEWMGDALRKLAVSCEEAADRLASKNQEKAESTNHKSAVRGFDLIVKFVNNIAGTSTTAEAREAIAKVLAVAEKISEYKASAKKRPNKKG